MLSFYVYLIPPYSQKLNRAFKKQTKLYLWDWSETQDESARFENMVAGHLLKACAFFGTSRYVARSNPGGFVCQSLRNVLNLVRSLPLPPLREVNHHVFNKGCL